MGTFLNGLDDHEGYPARRLPDGTLTGSWTHETHEFTAYVAACSCASGAYSYTDWYGPTEHPPTDAGEQAARTGASGGSAGRGTAQSTTSRR